MKVLWQDKLFESVEDFNDFRIEWEDQEADLEYFKKLLKEAEEEILFGKNLPKKLTNRHAQDLISGVFSPLYLKD